MDKTATNNQTMTEAIIPLLSLIALEVILGIDNIIFISLLAEGFLFEIPKGYIYFSMAFAYFVDVIQMKTIRHK